MSAHQFEPSHTGMVCDKMVTTSDGSGDQCGIGPEEHRRWMREECIAYETSSATIRALAAGQGTTAEIAAAVIAKVDEWDSKGDLAVLWESWVRDPDEHQS